MPDARESGSAPPALWTSWRDRRHVGRRGSGDVTILDARDWDRRGFRRLMVECDGQRFALKRDEFEENFDLLYDPYAEAAST